MNKKILIVEDEFPIANLIEINLNVAGYETQKTYDGLDAYNILQKESFDLILLDVMIPNIDGFELIEKIKHLEIPVIFLTAKNTVLNKVKGLKLGAEDYIIKPFESLELLARIEVVLRRYSKDNNILKFKDLTINLEERIVKKDKQIIELTIKEFELLVLLFKNKNMVFSRDQILERVWGYEYFGETRTIDNHIQKLRKKLDLTKNIKTVYKVGYRLED
ncbi:response regulator transcription factor [Maledivibacter halophilus]|uniref:Stage 0 sporulation protein A homolog n=1 Tax=Maledivibacter halophilus TaxID=36842 RepID=A0A1T5KQP9_9FIRM|nr:response regulator transcription factor [Maledivibacter halophilus]SKC65618.1 DNA-binding response regulator, OmpR family, contains REC and winged-helix (wHTH) domain [Maledivibacter halophilus]